MRGLVRGLVRGAVRGRGEGGDERGGETGLPAHVFLSYCLLTYLLMAFVLHGFECVAQCLGGQRGGGTGDIGLWVSDLGQSQPQPRVGIHLAMPLRSDPEDTLEPEGLWTAPSQKIGL